MERPGRIAFTFLVVDDDADILNFIQGVLEDEGLAVIAVPDGGQAVAVATELEPDMLIVDVTLPVLSGHPDDC